MTTPHDGKLLLVATRGDTTPGETPTDTAALLRRRVPNVAGVILRTSTGVSWQGALGNDEDPKAITGVRRIARWVQAFAADGLEVHAWGAPRLKEADDLAREIDRLAAAANVPGVASLLVAVEVDGWRGSPPAARKLMAQLRRQLNPGVHIGLMLDGRRNRSFEHWVEPWLEEANSLHPLVLPILNGRDQSIEAHLGQAYGNLLGYMKPIYPVMQAGFAGDRPAAGEIVQQGLAAAARAGGFSFFRLGSDLAEVDGRPVMDDDAYDAVAAIPWQEPVILSGLESFGALEALAVYNWGQVINATYEAAASAGADGWSWLASHPKQVSYRPEMNMAPYDGAPIDQWPLDPFHREQILASLARRYGQLGWAPSRVAAPAPQLPAPPPPPAPQPQPAPPPPAPAPQPQPAPPPPPQPVPIPPSPTPKLQSPGAKIGIHGHPAPIAPPAEQWDEWIGYLKAMGVRWYKQLDWGNPNDMQPDSTFAWAVRLKREGIEPIIRFYKAEQFPGRLDGFMFDKMRLYAGHDIRWVEIGNEPNLHYEWQSGWHDRVSCNDAGVIAALAEGWVADAHDALAAGARPALYAFSPTDWEAGRPHPRFSSVHFTRNLIKHLADRFRAETIDIFNRGGWIAVHCATYDRPIDFDPHSVNPPWDMALRGYEVPARAFRDFFGNALDTGGIPIISTEGGVFTEDCRYLLDKQKARDSAAHAAAVVGMYSYVEHSTPLLAMCPWCITTLGTHDEKFAGDGWIFERNGQRNGRAVTDALRQLRFDNDRRREDGQPGRGRVKLDIPHLSQLDETAQQRGDCGPTCLAMILNVGRPQPLTVDEIYRNNTVLSGKIGKSGPESYTSWWEMQTLLGNYGLAADQPTYDSAETALATLKQHVRNRTPVVVLVNYGRWASNLPDIAENRFNGPHFVLVTGCDDEYVFIHDPLFGHNRRSKGAFFPLTNANFLDGWGNLEGDNPNYSALVPVWRASRLEALRG